MIYEVNVTGYESYELNLFDSDLSRKEFAEVLINAYKAVMPGLLRGRSYIDGHKILDKVTAWLKRKGFKQIRADHVFNLHGECIYMRDRPEDKPDFLSDDIWEKILEHNKRINNQDFRTDERDGKGE